MAALRGWIGEVGCLQLWGGTASPAEVGAQKSTKLTFPRTILTWVVGFCSLCRRACNNMFDICHQEVYQHISREGISLLRGSPSYTYPPPSMDLQADAKIVHIGL